MKADKDITLEDLGLTEEEMKLFVDGAKLLFANEDTEGENDGTARSDGSDDAGE